MVCGRSSGALHMYGRRSYGIVQVVAARAPPPPPYHRPILGRCLQHQDSRHHQGPCPVTKPLVLSSPILRSPSTNREIPTIARIILLVTGSQVQPSPILGSPQHHNRTLTILRAPLQQQNLTVTGLQQQVSHHGQASSPGNRVLGPLYIEKRIPKHQHQNLYHHQSTRPVKRPGGASYTSTRPLYTSNRTLPITRYTRSTTVPRVLSLSALGFPNINNKRCSTRSYLATRTDIITSFDIITEAPDNHQGLHHFWDQDHHQNLRHHWS